MRDESSALVAAVPQWVRDAVADHTGTSLTEPERRRRLAQITRDFARSLDFALRIPGNHYGGLSNQELFDVLAAQGRDFGADSRQLDVHVRLAIEQEFEDATRLPTSLELRRIAAVAILEWVVARMERRISDVRIRALSYAYAKRKRALGLDSRPGIATGALLDAVKNARVEVS